MVPAISEGSILLPVSLHFGPNEPKHVWVAFSQQYKEDNDDDEEDDVEREGIISTETYASESTVCWN